MVKKLFPLVTIHKTDKGRIAQAKGRLAEGSGPLHHLLFVLTCLLHLKVPLRHFKELRDNLETLILSPGCVSELSGKL